MTPSWLDSDVLDGNNDDDRDGAKVDVGSLASQDRSGSRDNSDPAGSSDGTDLAALQQDGDDWADSAENDDMTPSWLDSDVLDGNNDDDWSSTSTKDFPGGGGEASDRTASAPNKAFDDENGNSVDGNGKVIGGIEVDSPRPALNPSESIRNSDRATAENEETGSKPAPARRSGYSTSLNCYSAAVNFSGCLNTRGSSRGPAVAMGGREHDIFSKQCRNASCLIDKFHEHLESECLPTGCTANSPECFAHKDEDSDGKPKSTISLFELNAGALPEFHCNDTNGARAVELIKIGIRRSRPIVLRGCAAKLPFVSKWTREYLVSADERTFQLYQSKDVDANGDLAILPGALMEDLADKTQPNVFTDFLSAFSDRIWAWMSKGGRTAQSQITSADTVHVMAREKKDIWLGSPHFLPSTYMDFVADDCPSEMYSDFGCDEFGCFHYMPWHDQLIDAQKYPAMRRVRMNTTTLLAGDAVFIPAYWLHAEYDYPYNMKGTNIALIFTHQRKVCMMLTKCPLRAL